MSDKGIIIQVLLGTMSISSLISKIISKEVLGETKLMIKYIPIRYL